MRKNNIILIFFELLCKFALAASFDCLDCEKNIFQIRSTNLFCAIELINSKIYALSNGSLIQYDLLSNKTNEFKSDFFNFNEDETCSLFSPDESVFIIIHGNKLKIWNKEKKLEICEIIENNKIIIFEGEDEENNYFYLVSNDQWLKSLNYKTCKIKNVTNSDFFLDVDIGAYDKYEKMFIMISFKIMEVFSFNLVDKCIQGHIFKADKKNIFIDFSKNMMYYMKNQSLAMLSYKYFNETIYQNEYLPIDLNIKVFSNENSSHLSILQNNLHNFYNFLLNNLKNAKFLKNNFILINSSKLLPIKTKNLHKKIDCFDLRDENFGFIDDITLNEFGNINSNIKNRFLQKRDNKNGDKRSHNDNNNNDNYNQMNNINQNYDSNSSQTNTQNSEWDRNLVVTLMSVVGGLICLFLSNISLNLNKN